MIGREIGAGDETYLYLEDAQSSSTWPWSDPELARAVCHALARLHDTRALPRELFSWDYEGELADSAQSTLQTAKDARDESGQRYWRRLGDLRRVVAALLRIRQRLLSGTMIAIHGDMHPGNVIVHGARLPADRHQRRASFSTPHALALMLPAAH